MARYEIKPVTIFHIIDSENLDDNGGFVTACADEDIAYREQERYEAAAKKAAEEEKALK